MPLVKCAACGVRLERDDARRQGIQSFHYKCPGIPMVRKKSTFKRTAPKVLPKALRKWVTQLDGGRCRYCGSWSNTHIHHVVYRSQGGPDEISNLITLCQEHHDLVHSDKARFMALCLGVIWLRNVHGDRVTLIPVLERKINERT